MADIDAAMKDWSNTSASNKPTGATSIGTGLDDNLREVQGSIVRNLHFKGADIASAGTTDLGAAEGLQHDITGTTTITSFGTVRAGVWKMLQFDGALTLTHNATSLILPGAENITTAAGDCAIFCSEGSGNWRCYSYVYAATLPTVAPIVGWYKTGGDAIRSPNSVTIDDSLTVSGATISTGSTAALSLGTTAGVQFQVLNVASVRNYWKTYGGATGIAPTLLAGGDGFDANVNGGIATLGAGVLSLMTNTSVEQVRIAHTASADIYVIATGGVIAGGSAQLYASTTNRLRLTDGIRVGADSTNNLLDDASTGAGTATLYIGNASINVTSDENLKRNIAELKDGLSIVRALLPIEYDQDDERPWGDVGHYVGFGARHSHKIAPWSVNTQGDTGLPWKMRQEFLMAPAIRAIQQIDERLSAIEMKLP
jgi:Chaperone of endosialidase